MNLKSWPTKILLKLRNVFAAKENRNNGLLEQIVSFLKIIYYLLLFLKVIIEPSYLLEDSEACK